MTRRTHVTRTADYSAPSETRALGGGAVIWCAAGAGLISGVTGLIEVALIPVTAEAPFQRFFASATVDRVAGWIDELATPAGVTLEIYTDWVGKFVEIFVPPNQVSGDDVLEGGAEWGWGHPAAITGAVDLPGGDHEIRVRMYGSGLNVRARYNRARMQVIEGQVLNHPECGGFGSA